MEALDGSNEPNLGDPFSLSKVVDKGSGCKVWEHIIFLNNGSFCNHHSYPNNGDYALLL